MWFFNSFVFLCLISFTCAADAFDVHVIVHKDNNVSELSKDDLRSVFLKKDLSEGSLSHLEPRDQTVISVKRMFYESYFDNTLESIEQYWVIQVFTGKSYPPQNTDTRDDRSMIEHISSNENAIGYIKQSALNPKKHTEVKVVKIL